MQLSQVSFFESMLIATDSRSPQLIKNITSSGNILFRNIQLILAMNNID